MEKSRFITAVKLEENSLFVKKLKNFQSRYCRNSTFSQNSQMPLMAPFELKKPNSYRVFDEFEEEIESFFIDQREEHYIKFRRIDFYQHKKKYLLFLIPELPIDFEYCLESLNEIKKTYANNIKKREFKKPYLLLGKFQTETELREALRKASREFILPVEVRINGFSLFENRYNEWRERRSFLSFEKEINPLIINERYHRLVV